MHNLLSAIQANLNELITQIRSCVPYDDPFGNSRGDWASPGLSRIELIEEIQSIIDLIQEQGQNHLGEYEPRIADYIRRLQHLKNSTTPQLVHNPGQAVSTLMLTLGGLRKILMPVLQSNIEEDVSKQRRAVEGLKKQIRVIEAVLTDLQPRSEQISKMLERIEHAHTAADQLPTDLQTLAEAQKRIADLASRALADQEVLSKICEHSQELDKQLNQHADDAKVALQQCETAYAAATSVGLAAAFSERSADLSTSIRWWIGGLILALISGSYFGSAQLHSLSNVLNSPTAPTAIIFLNLFLSLLSVGAPVWFAWLATKQIGQRFRLAEDYAFKASISRAYEGFRREAARFDQEMEARILSSALTRIDEPPLRLVETVTHGSPWHELGSSEAVKQAIQVVPDFAGQVKDLASKAISAVNPMHTKLSSTDSMTKKEA